MEVMGYQPNVNNTENTEIKPSWPCSTTKDLGIPDVSKADKERTRKAHTEACEERWQVGEGVQ